MSNYPDDVYSKAELGWILYEKEFRPARDEQDLERFLHVADRSISLEPVDLLRARGVLSVMRVAKERRKWAVVLAWSDQVSAEGLSDKPYVVDGHRNMPAGISAGAGPCWSSEGTKRRERQHRRA